MAQTTPIEWTDATWNPVTGCTKISAGCDNCYAERFAERFRGVPGHPFETGFDLTVRPSRLGQPLLWKKHRKIFVCSMSDLFHKDVPKAFVDRVFDTMDAAYWHTFQILTKRASRMRAYINARYPDGAPAHIWMGVTVENQAMADKRIPALRATRAAVRFLSVEPLLGVLGKLDLRGIHQVIVGGESGPGFRPLDVDAVRAVRDQCIAAHVAFFFKQHGGFRPKENGRDLDGRTWGEFPEGVA